MFQTFSGRLGRLIQRETPPSPMQEVKREQATTSARVQAASSTSAGMGEQSIPKPAEGLGVSIHHQYMMGFQWQRGHHISR